MSCSKSQSIQELIFFYYIVLEVLNWYFSVVGSSAETKVSIVEYGIGSSNDQIRDVSL